MSWRIVYTKQAQKDAKILTKHNLVTSAKKIIALLEKNPFQNPLPYEKLIGDLTGAYSRRINIQHRIIYELYKKERVVKIIRMWTHYE